MMYLSPQERQIADEIAERAGTVIPGTTNIVLIAFPVLAALLHRIEKLEARTKNLEAEREARRG